LNPSRKSRALAIWILVAVFAVGVGAGVGGAFYYFKIKHERRVERTAEDRDKTQVERMQERLTRLLKLTEEQRAAIGPELERVHSEMREINKKSRIEFRTAFTGHSEVIKTFLTPEQLERYEKHIKRRSEQWTGALRPKRPPPHMRKPPEGSAPEKKDDR